jgi:hypothetical protein
LVDLVERKCALAVALANGHVPGGDYTDANLVVAALVSGMAADLWPGDGIDRRRFLELWAREADPVFKGNLISVPLLYAELSKRALRPKDPDLAAADAATRLSAARPGLLEIETRVLAGHEVDMEEGEVLTLCSPALTPRDVREFSYPAIYYGQVRSAASHEYQLGSGATAHPMRLDADVSYSNRKVDGRAVRLIYFDLLWLWRVVRSIATAVKGEIDWGKKRERPKEWWVFGG